MGSGGESPKEDTTTNASCFMDGMFNLAVKVKVLPPLEIQSSRNSRAQNVVDLLRFSCCFHSGSHVNVNIKIITAHRHQIIFFSLFIHFEKFPDTQNKIFVAQQKKLQQCCNLQLQKHPRQKEKRREVLGKHLHNCNSFFSGQK